MEAFKEAWLAIDRHARNYVTMDDLEIYARKMNYDEKFVVKWKKLFDQDNSGIIRLEVFCDVLGLNASEIKEQARVMYKAGGLPSDVIYISGEMSLEWQLKIVQVTKEALRVCSKMSDVPKQIKTSLDQLYSQLWHVVITQGEFWCYFGHEPQFSFIFRIDKRVFIIFKTPCA